MKVLLLAITKRCERCEEQFTIPNIKQSKARELALLYTPCPYCKFVRDVKYPVSNKSGRCRSCSIGFKIINHHGKGFCHRCYMKHLRHK